MVADQLEAIPELKVDSKPFNFSARRKVGQNFVGKETWSIQYIFETGLIFDEDKVTGTLNIFRRIEEFDDRFFNLSI